MPPTLTPQEFVDKWRHTTLKESSAYQQHFVDLCRLVGHPTPAEADPKGEWFTFQADATKQSGSQGYADVWKKRFFAWEYKGKHADLDKAYQQLLQYREALENPPLLVVSDIEQIVIHTNFTNTVKQIYRLTFDDLLKPEGMARLRAVFFDPEALRAPQTTKQVTEAAAREFAHLADLLRKWGEDPQRIAHFLIQLLFCLFAEDVGLLPHALFSRLIEQMRTESDAFAQRLEGLFGAMTTGGWFGEHKIRHFDGGLFDSASVLGLDSDGLQILAQVSKLDWSSIEPSILGTLFERSLDPSKRAQIGAHYTGTEDILLIVEPVLMAPLRRRWAEVQADARALATRRDGTKNKSQRTRLQNELESLLAGFVDEIAQVQVLDPGCGSGNFLYVALRRLLDLQKEVSTFASELGTARLYPTASPSQLHGIEINAYAHELAQATVWIGYIQWLQENGFGLPSEPVLKPIETVRLMDAVLAYDEQGRPVEPAWPQADVIIGNPPFLGDKKMRSELGGKYVDDLRALYADRIPGQSDLVCYWFEKARAQIEQGRTQRAGLLATQGIRGGANRKVLERVKRTGDIFWAQSDRNWILDGAMVHVSMVAFDNGMEKERVLDGNPAEAINSDLTTATDLTKAQRLKENMGICFQGPVKVGSFEIDEATASLMLLLPNPHKQPNSDVIRPWVNGLDITNRPRKMYIIDFNVMPLEQAALYETPFEHIRQQVRPQREKNKRIRRREYWWQHGETVPGMRAALARFQRFICTPRVSKHRLFVWVPENTLPDSAVIAVARDEDYFFGVLHSKPHELWARGTGTQLREAESGFRYTPTSTFETFPFPWPPG
jgi:methylase of polypeptide subunit release factors